MVARSFLRRIRAASRGTTAPTIFDAIERQELLAFADLAASALRAANDRRERRIGRLSALNILAWELAAVHEPFAIAKMAFDAAATLVQRDSFSIARYDERNNELEFVVEARGDEAVPGETSVLLGSGPASEVVLAGEPFRTPNTVHLPMKSRGQLVGVLACGTDAPGVLDDETSRPPTLANRVATAFESVRLSRACRAVFGVVRALASAVARAQPYTGHLRARRPRACVAGRCSSALIRFAIQLGAPSTTSQDRLPDAILTSGTLSGLVCDMRSHPCSARRSEASSRPDLCDRAHASQRYDVGATLTARRTCPYMAYGGRPRTPSGHLHPACGTNRADLRHACADSFVSGTQSTRLCSIRSWAHRARPFPVASSSAASRDSPEDSRTCRARVLRERSRRVRDARRQLAILSARIQITRARHDELAERILRSALRDGLTRTIPSDARRSATTRDPRGGRTCPGLSATPSARQGISCGSSSTANCKTSRMAPRPPSTPREIRSVLSVPLQLGDERIGALGVESPRVAAFGREDEELLTAVSHQVAAAVRVAKLHQAAKVAAATDPLTGLPNRRSFFERLDRELAARDGAALSVAIVDANGLRLKTTASATGGRRGARAGRRDPSGRRPVSRSRRPDRWRRVRGPVRPARRYDRRADRVGASPSGRAPHPRYVPPLPHDRLWGWPPRPARRP